MDPGDQPVPDAERLLLITVDQVANLLQVSERTVWRMRSGGDIPAPVRVAGNVRWRLGEIKDWINAGCPKRSSA